MIWTNTFWYEFCECGSVIPKQYFSPIIDLYVDVWLQEAEALRNGIAFSLEFSCEDIPRLWEWECDFITAMTLQ